MKLHNTLTRKLEDFEPINNELVKLYTCGPTVYDYAHVGNLQSFIFDDTLRRVLQISGYKVKHIMNITDVGHLVSDADEGEDKLEKGAEREGKTVWEVADHYTQAFLSDVQALNILPPNGYNGRPDGYARATDFIAEQIAMIKLLVEKNFVYITEQAIYFDVTKLPDYGKLSGQKLSDKEVAVRKEVVTDPAKKHPYDFAVWFFAIGHFKDHSMKWPSPWGEGFPGWHLECSAIIHTLLGEPIDIHTGGVDHIGTHHTNEIAQTEAAYCTPLANYWLHNDFVLVDGVKMSKSKGNFYTLKDVVDRGYSPLAFRLLVLQSHYRSQLNFTWDSLAAAQSRLKDLQALADLRWQASEGEFSNDYLKLITDELPQKIMSALQNNLATPEVLALISEYEPRLVGGYRSSASDAFLNLLDVFDRSLGLRLLESEDLSVDQKQLIADRQHARAAQNWQQSDDLRDQLQQQGIGLRDTEQGPVWFRL